jgi:hypothetical protein
MRTAFARHAGRHAIPRNVHAGAPEFTVHAAHCSSRQNRRNSHSTARCPLRRKASTVHAYTSKISTSLSVTIFGLIKRFIVRYNQTNDWPRRLSSRSLMNATCNYSILMPFFNVLLRLTVQHLMAHACNYLKGT